MIANREPTLRTLVAAGAKTAAALFVSCLGVAACSSAPPSADARNRSAEAAGAEDGAGQGTRSAKSVNPACADTPPGVSLGMETGNQLPDLVVQDCDGKELSLSSFCGAKATWLYLVHAWCPHVQAVSGFAEAMHDSLATKGLVSVHVMVENSEHRAPTQDDCRAWKERWGLEDVKLVFDQTGVLKGLMDSEFTSVSSFLDQEQVIRKKTHTDVEASLRKEFETLLGP